MRAVGQRVEIRGRPVRLTPGRHATPGDGACVVELASVLANEEFSDRPQCVCPVIAAFLRGWNDRSAYAHRQGLAPYAERIIDTRGSRQVTRERRDMCLEWTGANLRRGPLRRVLTRLRIRPRIALLCGPRHALRLKEGAGEYAARVLYGRRDVDGAFFLLDAMLAIGAEPPAQRDPRSVNGNGRVPHTNGQAAHPPLVVNGNGGPPASTANGNGAGQPDRAERPALTRS